MVTYVNEVCIQCTVDSGYQAYTPDGTTTKVYVPHSEVSIIARVQRLTTPHES